MKMFGKHIPFSILCAAALWGGGGPAHADARPANSGEPATLSGRAFLTSMGGEAVTCAGRDVTVRADDGQAPSAGSAVGVVARPGASMHEICDRQGNFTFSGLTVGDWTIGTSIRWDVRAKQGIRHLGGDVVQHVALRAGDNVVVLNDRDLYPRAPDASRVAAIIP